MKRPRFSWAVACGLLFASLLLLSCSSGDGNGAADASTAGFGGGYGGASGTGAVTPGCGNGILEPALGEQCDGANLGAETCASLGEGTGQLTCTATCMYDVTSCTQTASVAGSGGGY